MWDGGPVMTATMSVLIGTGLAIGVVSFLSGIFFLFMRARGVKTLAELPGVGEISTLQLGVSLMSVGGYCFWHAAATYAPLAHGEELQSRFNQALVQAGTQLRSEYRRAVGNPRLANDPDRFARVTLLIEVLTQLDDGNGHALYFAGEVKRREGKPIEAHQQFYRYFEMLERYHIAEDQGETGAEFCYTQPHGFCRQRSGWIRHLMADDYYRQSQLAGDPQERATRLEGVVKHAEAALRDYPGGYDGLDQGQPTRQMLERARAEIARIKG